MLQIYSICLHWYCDYSQMAGHKFFFFTMFIAIKSGKHSSSTASTHAQDFETILILKEFEELVKTEGGFIKPVITGMINGGSIQESLLPESYIICY